MRIVVTGVTGFVGSHFAERALAEGHEVVGLYHSDQRGKQELRADLARRGVELHRADVSNPPTLVAAMQGADCVCHFAAAFKESGVDDDYFRRLNSDGTINTIEAAAAAGVRRFVLCSTAGIYGQRVSGVIDESAEPRPWNIYEETKLAAETELRARAARLGMEYVILRPTAVYGPRDDRLLKLFKAAAKGRFPLFGKGEGRRHMVYVTDLAAAFLLACTTPGAASKEMIVGGPQAVHLHEMLSTLAEAVDRPSCGPRLPLKPMLLLSAVVEDVCKVINVKPPIYRRRMDFYMNDAAFSSKLAEQVLGWVPKVSLREGIGITVAAYRDAGTISTASLSVGSRAALMIAFPIQCAVSTGHSVYEKGGFLI